MLAVRCSGQEDPAEDPPRSPHGDVRWSEAHVLWDTLEMPRAGKEEPCTGGIPAREQRGNRATILPEPCNIPARLRGDRALVLRQGRGVPVLCPHRAGSPAVPCLSFPSAQRARSHHPRPGRRVLAARFVRMAEPGQGGCPPACTFGLNPGVPLCADTSKNNRPERSANRRLFIALHP